MRIQIIIISIFILYFSSVTADLNSKKELKTCNITIVFDELTSNESFDLSKKKNKLKTKNIEVIDKILQSTENLLNYISIGLAVVSLIITIIVGVAIKWMTAARKKAKRELEKSKNDILTKYTEIKDLFAKADTDLHKLSGKTKKSIKKIKNKAAEEFNIQTEEITLLTSKANKKLDETNEHLKKLDIIDELTRIKISAIQNTLIRCLDYAPDRNKAFSIYTKLLAAYEVLLKDPYQEITPTLEEEMLIKATLIQGNKQYVPLDIIDFMKKEMNLPDSVLDVLWSDS